MAGLSGSAPRVRGTAACRPGRVAAYRFSPACAGNGLIVSSTSCVTTVQPRVCGERAKPRNWRGQPSGSAPRVRGTEHDAGLPRVDRRFSPACAGNGWGARASSSDGAVQPRVCGERLTSPRCRCISAGSAPRVRGTVLGLQNAGFGGRFSPACAGNGWPPIAGSRCRPVQPRVCGERQNEIDGVSSRDGSAPRVRGTVENQRSNPAAGRFSPACAGNGLASIPLMSRSIHDVKERHQHEQQFCHYVLVVGVTLLRGLAVARGPRLSSTVWGSSQPRLQAPARAAA